MTVFGERTVEEILAEEILDAIKQCDWKPSVNAMSAIISLVKVLEYITRNYSAYEEMKDAN